MHLSQQHNSKLHKRPFYMIEANHTNFGPKFHFDKHQKMFNHNFEVKKLGLDPYLGTWACC